MSLTRNDFQNLARTRLKEARHLLRAKHYDGAYYLSVECALKACIAKNARRYDFPDKKVVDGSYTHDLSRLIKTAGLEADLDRDTKKSPALERNWSVVKDWGIESRYDLIGKKEAEDIYSAITSRYSVVVPWLRQRW